jgi:cell division protein FtsN
MGIEMADNVTDDALEEMPSEEGSSNLASKILSKPMLIKIAIGLTVLMLIAGGAYFYFMSSDEPSPEEAALDANGEIISPTPTSESSGTEGDPPNSETSPLTKEYTAEDIKILKMREEAVALKEENLQMKERLSKLEGTQNPNVEITIPESDTTTPEGDAIAPEDNTKDSEADSKPKLKTNPYANLYSRDDTLVREPSPEPKWGEFDPLYRGK